MPHLNIEHPGELEVYLRASGHVRANERIAVRTLPGGVSNRTVWVTRAGGDDWVVKQSLEKLRVAVDWFSDPSRIRREAAGMRWLAELAPAGTTPRLVFEDPACHLLAMEAVPQPHQNWKDVLLSGRVESDRVRQFAELLATIHRRAAERRDELATEFAQREFFESLRLEPYYAFTAGNAPEAAGFLHALIAETRSTAETLVHGDYSPKNILTCGPRMVLLDHEVIHWGDPAFDLGFSLTHLLSKGHLMRDRRATFAAAARQYWSEYLRVMGPNTRRDGLEPRVCRHALGCLLARVAGRSPLEYLDAAQRSRQAQAVVSLMARRPVELDELITLFFARL